MHDGSTEWTLTRRICRSFQVLWDISQNALCCWVTNSTGKGRVLFKSLLVNCTVLARGVGHPACGMRYVFKRKNSSYAKSMGCVWTRPSCTSYSPSRLRQVLLLCEIRLNIMYVEADLAMCLDCLRQGQGEGHDLIQRLWTMVSSRTPSILCTPHHPIKLYRIESPFMHPNMPFTTALLEVHTQCQFHSHL